MSCRWWALTASVLGLLSGCAVGPDYKRPDVATPEQYKEASPSQAVAASPPAQQWWTQFNDPMLDDLESRVEVSNQNLAAAEASYRQAAAVVHEQRAGLFPSVAADASATKAGGQGRDSTTSTSAGGTDGRTSRSGDSYQAGASASWEIDLWGRLRRTLENAHALADASADDLASAKLSLQTELATTYLQLREADAELRLLADTVTAYARALQIAQNRYNAGVAVKTDVLQAQTQLANTEAQSAALVLTRAQAEHAIAALIGQPAASFTIDAKQDWRADVPQVPSSVPSTLLERRPDIAASERRVAAANASIGIEEAAYFPSLTLSGSYDFAATSAETLFRSASAGHSIAASAAQTLFDAGKTHARVVGARAAYDQSVAQYRQTVLGAFQDVEDQLAAVRQLERQYELRRQASEAADESEQLTFNQYRAGTVSYTNVVVAQTAALSARVTLARIMVQRQTAAISLIQALGGDWTRSS